jgi:hypothetical protein
MAKMAQTLASSVWGVILARYVTPILVFIILAAGGYVGSQVLASIEHVANQQDKFQDQLIAAQSRITAIEARRDATVKARDDQIALILDAQRVSQTRLDLIGLQVAGLSAKVEILIDRENP